MSVILSSRPLAVFSNQASAVRACGEASLRGTGIPARIPRNRSLVRARATKLGSRVDRPSTSLPIPFLPITTSKRCWAAAKSFGLLLCGSSMKVSTVMSLVTAAYSSCKRVITALSIWIWVPRTATILWKVEDSSMLIGKPLAANRPRMWKALMLALVAVVLDLDACTGVPVLTYWPTFF